jgi:hypothetical protein
MVIPQRGGIEPAVQQCRDIDRRKPVGESFRQRHDERIENLPGPVLKRPGIEHDEPTAVPEAVLRRGQTASTSGMALKDMARYTASNCSDATGGWAASARTTWMFCQPVDPIRSAARWVIPSL